MGWITDQILRIVSRLYMGPSGFDKAIIQAANSPTYETFCERVYGINLCQMNMMDAEQMEKLQEIMALSDRDLVLDAGCGAGFIAEHIARTTGAHVIGLDFAGRAIEAARKRFAAGGNLTFVKGDLNSLAFPARHFDAIICIDALYFVKDLDSTVLRLKEILKPEGRMGIFYSGKVTEDKPASADRSQMTKLAEILDKQGFVWKSWDFTRNELAIWKKALEVADDLREQLLREGGKSLYASRTFEARCELKRHQESKLVRHLYHATPSLN